MVERAFDESLTKGSRGTSIASISDANQLLRRFEGRVTVTVATGTTCAFLGDERNLREFVVADEAAKALSRAGHVAHNLLFDDSLDPLTEGQLRIAVNKDPELIAHLAGYCGRPIDLVPDPWGCHGSFAAHFEEALLQRLTRIGCRPNLVSTARLYESGAYLAAVDTVLDRREEIEAFLARRFPDYTPQALYYPICPSCRRIVGTRVVRVGKDQVEIECARCDREISVPRRELRGKLSWKLDCAVRWAMFQVDAELFSKAYLEPKSGTYAVAQALCVEFFAGSQVVPILYGVVQIDGEVSGKLLDSLTPACIRSLFAHRWPNDLKLTRERVVLEASKARVYGDLSLIEFSKQIMPIWLLDPSPLTTEQLTLLGTARTFASHFLGELSGLELPCADTVQAIGSACRADLARVLEQALLLRSNCKDNYGAFDVPMKAVLERLGPNAKEVTDAFRTVTGIKKGPPTRRLLFTLPESYLRLLAFVLDLASSELRLESPSGLRKAA